MTILQVWVLCWNMSETISWMIRRQCENGNFRFEIAYFFRRNNGSGGMTGRRATVIANHVTWHAKALTFIHLDQYTYCSTEIDGSCVRPSRVELDNESHCGNIITIRKILSFAIIMWFYPICQLKAIVKVWITKVMIKKFKLGMFL